MHIYITCKKMGMYFILKTRNCIWKTVWFYIQLYEYLLLYKLFKFKFFEIFGKKHKQSKIHNLEDTRATCENNNTKTALSSMCIPSKLLKNTHRGEGLGPRELPNLLKPQDPNLYSWGVETRFLCSLTKLCK